MSPLFSFLVNMLGAITAAARVGDRHRMSKEGTPFQASLSLSSCGILHTAGVDAQGLRHTRAVGRICLGEVRDLPLLIEARHSLHGTGDVCDEACLGRGVHQAE